MSKTHLIIGDPHARPGQSLRRFAWLGRMIRALAPDVVIDVGDQASMDSLSSYDKGKASGENKRYHKDIDAAWEAQELVANETGKMKVQPRFIRTLGNHENRINRFVSDTPALQGELSTDDLGGADYGWEVRPYQDVVTVDGVDYSHTYAAGIMNRPISGMHQAHALIHKRHRTSVCGHSHLLDHRVMRMDDGRQLHGLVAGCFFEHREGYAGPANGMWWRGICVLKDVRGGRFDLETYSIDRVRKGWG